MKARKLVANALAFALLGSMSLGASAGTISVDVNTAQAGIQADRTAVRSTTVEVEIYYAPASGESISSVSGQLAFNTALLTASSAAVVAPATGDCSIASPGVIGFLALTIPTLAEGPVCRIQFAVASDAALGATPLTLSNLSSGQTAADGQLTITEGDPNVLLQFMPAPGGATIELPGNVAGAVVNTSISVEAQGTIGSGTVTGCTISGTGATAFGPAPGDITVNAGGTGTLPLSCTLPASQAATAQLQCIETDSDSAGVSRTWQLRCPVGTVAPVDPAITPATAAGAFGMPAGAIGQTVSRTLQFTPSGGAGSGSSTVTCTPAGGSPVTVTPATLTFTGSTTTPQSFTVRIPLTDADQGPFDLTCAINDSGADRNVVYNVTAAAGSPFVLPEPKVVPASSTWSQLLLIALMAGLGLAFVGFRRQS